MKPFSIALLLILCVVARGERSVDFRFKPPLWQTAIGLPDDPEKTLVDQEGRLLHDYRDGLHFNLTLGVDVSGVRLIGQRLVAPRIPIVRTMWKGNGLEVTQHAFAVIDEAPALCRLRFTRLDQGRVLRGWARVGPDANPLLSNAAFNETDALRFSYPVPAGAKRLIAMNVNDGRHDRKAVHLQTMSVEGDASRTIDAMKGLDAHWFDAADADGNGSIDIEIRGVRGAIVNALWAFDPNAARNEKALVAGELDAIAEAVSYAADKTILTPRCDAILVDVVNTSNQTVRVSPTLVVESLYPLCHDRANDCFRTGSHECVKASIRVEATERNRRSLAAALEPFELAPGASRRFHVSRSVGRAAPTDVSMEKAEAFWNAAVLPYGRVSVPDERIQSLIDSSIRNIWQAREIKDGLPSFQVGPTCYRDLWIIDAAFILETVATLGEWEAARRGVEHVLSRQEPDGRFELLERGHKENGIVLWTCVRHAQLTRDKKWLRSVWPKLRRTAEYIKTLRERALENDTPLDDGLIPAGFVDGGLPNRDTPELSNTYWCLIGLKAAVEGARWIGEDDTALRKEFESYLAAFYKVAARAARTDAHGNRYLPILMGDAADVAPEKGQWTFLHAAYPGLLFAEDDPLLLGGLAMLEATEEQGMVVNTGWLDDGVWTYFAPFYAHAWLWLGRADKAVDGLYAMANHAAPTLVWREEQPLAGRTGQMVGDMPHNWASAEFVRLVVHLVAFERGDELHLLEGLPQEWLKPGMETKLDGVLTRFGPLSMSLIVTDDGASAHLHVSAIDASCAAIVVHAPNGEIQRLKPGAFHDLVWPVLKRP